MSSPPPTEPGAADRLLSTLAFVATAIILAAAIWFLIDGDGTGWILILVALLPLLAGVTLRRRSRRRR